MNIDEADVIAAIDRLKNNLTSGPGGFPPVFFRHLKYAIAIAYPRSTFYSRFYELKMIGGDDRH